MRKIAVNNETVGKIQLYKNTNTLDSNDDINESIPEVFSNRSNNESTIVSSSKRRDSQTDNRDFTNTSQLNYNYDDDDYIKIDDVDDNDDNIDNENDNDLKLVFEDESLRCVT